MRIKKLLLFIFISSTISSQEIQNIDKKYLNYFKLTREIPFLHLNKTSFMKGEEVWFKAYVLEQNKRKLHPTTSNLYVSIYNKDGRLKDRKLIYIKDGIGKGNIKIDSTFKSNIYYLKAHSKWMGNFVEKQEYFQKIKIISASEQEVIEKKREYDIQLLPESGTLITNTINTIGVLIKDNKNKGVEIVKGEVFNSEGKKIKEFFNNEFGLGKFSFLFKEKEQYKVIFTFLDDEKVEKKIENVSKLGVNLSVSNPNTSYVNIKVSLNSETLSLLKGKQHHIYIHNTNSFLKRTITFKEEKQVYELLIKNKKLKKGVNIITLFDNRNRPLAERLIFNYHKDLFTDVSITKNKISKDSIRINLRSKSDSIVTYLSASFLPLKTKSYNPENNIYTSFLLKPYIKGKIQNASNYFKNINRKKLNDLDLLLLTQGWSKYNWNQIFNNTPKIIYKGERGISIQGTLNMKGESSNGKISLFSIENDLYLTKNYSNNKFEFSNLHLKDSSSVSILYENAKGKQKKYKGYLGFSSLKSFDKLKVQPKEFKLKEDVVNMKTSDFIKDVEVLDEIVLKSKLRTIRKPERGTADRAIKIDSMYSPNTLISNFLRVNGFGIKKNKFGDFVFIKKGASYEDIKISKLYLNNIDITLNSSEITRMRLNQVDEVHIGFSGYGTINIFTKRILKKEFKNMKKDFKVPFGYSNSKEYYQPKYADTENEFFYTYGTLFWKPSIILNSDSKNTSFKIPVLNQKRIKVFIEGITSKGSLISIEKILKLE